mmetsp:Transcript_33877/g.100920  ORF Transcript_33877/g.100920 Transcript_33877/m.100920 type:complete len:248 (-) Transcript_33877:29-772(-)
MASTHARSTSGTAGWVSPPSSSGRPRRGSLAASSAASLPSVASAPSASTACARKERRARRSPKRVLRRSHATARPTRSPRAGAIAGAAWPRSRSQNRRAEWCTASSPSSARSMRPKVGGSRLAAGPPLPSPRAPRCAKRRRQAQPTRKTSGSLEAPSTRSSAGRASPAAAAGSGVPQGQRLRTTALSSSRAGCVGSSGSSSSHSSPAAAALAAALASAVLCRVRTRPMTGRSFSTRPGSAEGARARA